jgi:acyl-coenzyme A thioesterase PaaI-like protein
LTGAYGSLKLQETTMTPYDMIKAQLGTIVPFQNFVGVELLELVDGKASAQLAQRDETTNHIKTQHAGAMFTLGEAASGAALAPVILSVRPVAAGATIAFTKIAKGTLTAHAKTSVPSNDLLAKLEADGKVAFEVLVDIQDSDKDTVAEMAITWHVSRKQS